MIDTAALSTATSVAIQFSGWVACRREGKGPLGLILLGATTDHPGELLQLAFSAPAPAGLPDALENVRVESLDTRRYRIVSGPLQWEVEGEAHCHREIGVAFNKAVPSRAVPWRKRIFWRSAFVLASNRLVQHCFLRAR